MTLAVDEPRLQPYAPILLAALLVASAFVATIGGWAIFARLDAAVVAPGALHADSERKSVEHLEGGILAELLVRAGDRVQGGQVVARLDTTQIRETLTQLEAELDQARFAAWRLEAENAGRAPDLTRQPDGPAGDLRGAAEMALYEARIGAHRSQIAALEREIDQARAEIVASEARAKAGTRQVALWTEERDHTETLVQRGATPRHKLYEFDRALAQAMGERDEHEALAAAAQQSIARAESEIRTLEEQRRVEIVSALVETRGRIETLASQVRTARDILLRQDLRAPQAGRVVEIATVTPGAVVAPGEPLMTILPENDELVVLIHLHPATIDSVDVGVPAQVRFTAAKKAGSPVVPGVVSYVSADTLIDETGESYFEARVSLDPAAVAELDGVTPLAGMPVEASLTIGERRAGSYLVEPLLRRFGRAMREE